MLLIGKDSCKSEVYMKYIGNKYGGVDEIYKYIYICTLSKIYSSCAVCICVLVCM